MDMPPILMPEFHVSHVICEVWNENDKRWMLVDPSTGMIDFSREKFDFSNEAWLQMQKKEIDPNLYGIPDNIADWFRYWRKSVLIWHRYWEPNIQFINMHP